MNFGQRELEQLLQMLPNVQANDSAIMTLQDWIAQSKVERQLYSYNNNLVAAAGGAANGLAAGAVSAAVLTNVDASAMFLWTSTSYQANTLNAAQTGATRVYPNASVMIVDQGSGRQMMDVSTPITSIAGDGQFPYILPEPRLIGANSTLSVVYTNYDAAAGYNLRLTFNGFKIFRLSA